MSCLSALDELAAIRDEARLLARRAGDHEDDLRVLVVAAERHLRNAEEALSAALDGIQRSVADRDLLRSVLRNRQDEAGIAKQLCVAAHAQHVAADALLAHVERHSSELTDGRIRPDAVLVVDDYGEVREVIATVLGNAGFLVRTASNGLEGLLAAHEMRPRVIVMDLTMPVLDGIAATRLIKANEATRHARVIAYSGNPVLDDRLVEALFTAVMPKPATPAALLATVRQVASL